MSGDVIVRLPNWLGDTVMAVPALRALRTGLAGASILAAGPWAAMLADQGLADRLVDYPRRWAGRLRMADTVREFRGETAVLLPNSLEAALAAVYWRARRRVGFATDGRGWLLTDTLPLPDPRAHQVDEYLLLAERLGVTAGERIPHLMPPAETAPQRQRVKQLFGEAGLPEAASGARRVIGVHLGAAWGPAKTWPLARVIEFCALVRDAGDAPLLLGSPADEAASRQVVSRTGAATLVGRDAPALLPALLSSLDALVSGDTGVAHLAAALGTPVVVLFGPTDPRLSAPRGPVVVVTRHEPCAPCFYRTCPIDHPCLAGIEAPEVEKRVRALIGIAA